MSKSRPVAPPQASREPQRNPDGHLTDYPHCEDCQAPLSAWERRGRCGCRGPRSPSHVEVLYAVAATSPGPLRVRDFVRLAEAQFGHRLSLASANVTLMDRRFCWAGQSTYGLYRHGPLPGPRSLEPAARLVLTVAAAPMTLDAMDYCLKQLGYRYSYGSLKNAVNRSASIRARIDGLHEHPQGEAAERQLRQEVLVVPPRERAAWIQLRSRLAVRLEAALTRRAALVARSLDVDRFGLDWTPPDEVG